MAVLISFAAAFVVSGLAGVLLESTIIRRLYGRPLETLLATFGVSLVLQQLVRSIFSANQAGWTHLQFSVRKIQDGAGGGGH